MIVIGTHGRTGLAKLFLGSVAGRVVSTAKCPVDDRPRQVTAGSRRWGAGIHAGAIPRRPRRRLPEQTPDSDRTRACAQRGYTFVVEFVVALGVGALLYFVRKGRFCRAPAGAAFGATSSRCPRRGLLTGG